MGTNGTFSTVAYNRPRLNIRNRFNVEMPTPNLTTVYSRSFVSCLALAFLNSLPYQINYKLPQVLIVKAYFILYHLNILIFNDFIS